MVSRRNQELIILSQEEQLLIVMLRGENEERQHQLLEHLQVQKYVLLATMQ